MVCSLAFPLWIWFFLEEKEENKVGTESTPPCPSTQVLREFQGNDFLYFSLFIAHSAHLLSPFSLTQCKHHDHRNYPSCFAGFIAPVPVQTPVRDEKIFVEQVKCFRQPFCHALKKRGGIYTTLPWNLLFPLCWEKNLGIFVFPFLIIPCHNLQIWLFSLLITHFNFNNYMYVILTQKHLLEC